jgi:hypothetical protein
MDILSKLFGLLVDWATSLSPRTIQFWLRLDLLLVLPIGACAWTFRRGFRSVFVQILAGVVGALTALSLPLNHVRIESGLARLWFLSIAVLIVIFIPLILPSLLLPTLGAQQRLRKILVIAIGALVLANLIWG